MTKLFDDDMNIDAYVRSPSSDQVKWYRDIPGNPDFVKKLIDTCNSRIFRRSVIPLANGGVYLHKYLTEIKPKRCLEIGTYFGVPSLVMAQYCSEVITIDIRPEPFRLKLWDHFGVRNKIKTYVVGSEYEKERLIKNLDFDFCLMDGDHTYNVYSDFMMVRKCGNVLMHDYSVKNDREKCLVRELVDSLPYKHEVTIHGPDEFVFWQKKEKHFWE